MRPHRASVSSPAAYATPQTGGVGGVLWWHGAWALAAGLSGLALYRFVPDASLFSLTALGVTAAPCLLGAIALPLFDRDWLRSLLLVVWSVCAGAAVVLTGGLTGPLALWCLLPLAAAAVLGRDRLMPLAAALCVFTAGIAAMGQLAGVMIPVPSPGVGFWLTLLGLASTGLGLAAGLLMPARARGGEGALSALEADLAAQPHLILTLSPQGRALSAYGAVSEGVGLDELFEAGLAALAVPADHLAIDAALDAAARQGGAQVGFSPVRAPQAYVVADLRRLADGRIAATLRDASAERSHAALLERAKADAEALSAGKSRFLANMSHELRTPLNAIMGFSDIMRTQMFGPLTGKYAEYAELIHESGRHLLDLINDVLDMSKIQAERYDLAREIFDVREPVSAALRLMRVQADEAGVKLRGVLPRSLVEANADRRALKQIVINLVSNAVKFTPAGGQVTVTVQAYGDMLELSVVDDGVGISAEDLSRLGRPFEQVGDTTKQMGGTGLGLSLVRAFAELHGGEMIIESRLGEGTAVTVRLPVLGVAPIGPSEPGEAEGAGANVVAFPASRQA